MPDRFTESYRQFSNDAPDPPENRDVGAYRLTQPRLVFFFVALGLTIALLASIVVLS